VAANGEVFDMTAMTAAHRKLPLGSLVRVVNLINGKHVHVRINDRGPYVNGRMLDVSHAAAVELGMVDAGVSIIHLEVIGRHRPIDPVMQVPRSVIVGKLLQEEHVLRDRSEDLETPGFVPEIKSPPPTERFFPREALYGRRERRHTAILAGSDTAPAVPTLAWG
jgi:rare lipoprotein A